MQDTYFEMRMAYRDIASGNNSSLEILRSRMNAWGRIYEETTLQKFFFASGDVSLASALWRCEQLQV
jgi:hypothetical protein